MYCSSHILKEGPGTPLVFLHGFLGKSEDWEGVISHLTHCPCIGVDLPGHGLSSFHETFDFSPPAPRFHLIGYSMGGRLAMQYALRFAERIDRLLLIGAHPGLKTEKEKKERLQSDAKWADLLLHLSIDEFL
ncbi:MAG: alpha/beta fold hydrolase, partial [Chlamydiae bacterium]|nr:alpha/beta fold hydrolase [Chlamydiota bacterium]